MDFAKRSRLSVLDRVSSRGRDAQLTRKDLDVQLDIDDARLRRRLEPEKRLLELRGTLLVVDLGAVLVQDVRVVEDVAAHRDEHHRRGRRHPAGASGQAARQRAEPHAQAAGVAPAPQRVREHDEDHRGGAPVRAEPGAVRGESDPGRSCRTVERPGRPRIDRDCARSRAGRAPSATRSPAASPASRRTCAARALE